MVKQDKKWVIQLWVQAHHKTLNDHLKNWGILSQVFHHNILWHSDALWAFLVVTQLTIENCKSIFLIDYED